MSYVFIKVYCPHYDTPNVKKNGIKGNGKQNFYCKCCRKQFQLEYKYQGEDPRIKRQIPAMAMRASGIRDIATVLKISALTVVSTLRIWFKTLKELHFDGIYENVILDEFWSWVGKSKQGKRWV